MRLRLLSLALLCFLCAPGAAEAKKVRVDDVKPTQMEIGRAATHQVVEEWRTQAAHKGMSLEKFVKKQVVKRINRRPLPVIIDPEGAVRNTDGHHRVEALRQVEHETGGRYSVKIKVLKDYRGYDQARYARHFLGKLGKGQFTPEIEALPPEERIQHLPASYDKLRDSSMRSALGAAFSRMHLKSAGFVDYVEFKVGERLVKDGLLDDLAARGIVRKGARTLPSALAFDDRVQHALEEHLQRPAVRRMLLDYTIDDHARAAVNRALDEHAAR